MNMYDENFEFLVNYYNFDRGTDLPAEPDELRFPHRAICANIAWCMFNKERFWEYYNKSEYWKVKLMTAAKFYVSKYNERARNDSRYYMPIHKSVIDNLGRKFILRPCGIEELFDIDTVHIIAADAQGGFNL